jgi:hypothetical protein
MKLKFLLILSFCSSSVNANEKTACSSQQLFSKYDQLNKLETESNFFEQMEDWISTMKPPYLEFPTYKEELVEKNEHWVNFCTNGKLGTGLSYNQNGKIGGKGEVHFDETSECFNELDVEKVDGTFINGFLDGMAWIHFRNMSFFAAPFHRGTVSGLARMFSCKFGFCDFEEPAAWNVPDWLTEVSFFFMII